MSSSIQRVVCGSLAALGLSCTEGASSEPSEHGAESIGEQTQAIVYGDDDRQDLFEVKDDALREIARASVAAMIPTANLHRPASGGIRIAAPTLKEAYKLCDGESFTTQPSAASCSAVLIDRDLLLTAGHCLESDSDCRNNSFVFDYAYRAEGELESISASDVYGCRKIVTQLFTQAGPDYAIVQLDRVPKGRAPVEVRQTALEVSTPLTVMGFSSGLPLKVDQGAVVREGHPGAMDFFALDSDTYEGSSGSPVFDADHLLAGVLVRGGDDYINQGRSCYWSVHYTETRTPSWGWEQASYVMGALEDLCDKDYPSERLCGIKPRCGDGFCSADAVDVGCVEDCAAACPSQDCTKGGSGGVTSEPAPEKPQPSEARAESSGCALTPGTSGTTHGNAWLYSAVLAGLLAARRRKF